MKYIKYLFILLVVAFLAMLAIGKFGGPVTYTSEVTIDAPPTATWVALQNPMRMGEWIDGYKSMEFVSGFPGTIGSQMKLIFEENGKRMEIMETITAREEMEQLAFDMQSDWLTANTDIRLSSIGITATKLSATTSMKGDGALKHGMLFMTQFIISGRDQANYDRFKTMVEG